jgi:hypothetical protein
MLLSPTCVLGHILQIIHPEDGDFSLCWSKTLWMRDGTKHRNWKTGQHIQDIKTFRLKIEMCNLGY